MSRAVLMAIAAAALQLATGADAAAQHAIALDPALRVATAYEGRGLTFHDGLAGQLTVDLVMAAEGGGPELRAGVWTNAELVRGNAGLTMLADAAPGLSEVNLYVSGSRPVGTTRWTAGWIYFLWPTGFDFSDAAPLHEVFVSLTAPLPTVAGASLDAAVYYDFTAGGAYAELRAGAELPAVAGATPALALSVGGVVDQEEYYARRDGLTHVGLTLGVEREGRWTRIRPELGWTIALDAAARAGAWTRDGRHKLHVGVSVAPR